jgi:hypothetical protein
MPARCTPDKSEPIASKLWGKISMTIDVACSVQRSKFGCVKCDALFPASEGLVSPKYILLDSDADE